MKKIPTLFVRDPENRKYVLPEVTPGCEWVIAGEGEATKKFDGTCVLVDEAHAVWTRREVKPGKETPRNFHAVDHDGTTGKTVGWEPMYESGFYDYVEEALTAAGGLGVIEPGTYELCGPKVNGNPEGLEHHQLIRHGRFILHPPDGTSFEGLKAWMTGPDFRGEGVVWHHPDGRMVKLKRRDFPSAEPSV